MRLHIRTFRILLFRGRKCRPNTAGEREIFLLRKKYIRFSPFSTKTKVGTLREANLELCTHAISPRSNYIYRERESKYASRFGTGVCKKAAKYEHTVTISGRVLVRERCPPPGALSEASHSGSIRCSTKHIRLEVHCVTRSEVEESVRLPAG